MKMPSFGHIRLAVLFFFVFFALSGAAQFLFVRNQSDRVIRKDFVDGAKNLNQALAYDNGIDVKNYSKALVESPSDYIIFNDGSVFEYYPDPKVGVPAGLLPPVESDVLTEKVFKEPSTISYSGHRKEPEKWTLFGKRLDKGYVIVGVSEYDQVSGTEDALRTNLDYFGSTLDSAQKVDPNKIDNFVQWALIDDKEFF